MSAAGITATTSAMTRRILHHFAGTAPANLFAPVKTGGTPDGPRHFHQHPPWLGLAC